MVTKKYLKSIYFVNSKQPNCLNSSFQTVGKYLFKPWKISRTKLQYAYTTLQGGTC